MPFVLRQSQDEENPRLPDAYGRQITAGRLVYYDDSPRRFISFLCRGGEYGCEGIESVYYHGREIPSSQWRFHPGTITKQIEPKECLADTKDDRIECLGHGYVAGDHVRFRAIGEDATMPENLKAETMRYKVAASPAPDTDYFYLTDELGTPVAPTTTGTGTLIVWNANDSGVDDLVQGKPQHFPGIQYTFSGICYVEGFLPTDTGPQTGEPDGLKFVMKCRKLAKYDVNGDIEGVPEFSANNALVAADILLQELKLPSERIDWASWHLFKADCEVMVWHRINSNSSFTTGNGLTGSYYNSTLPDGTVPDFSSVSHVKTRTGETIKFDFGDVPAVPYMPGLHPEWFLVKWEGKLKPAFSEIYTFKAVADNGIRLTVNGEVVINRWSNTYSTIGAPDVVSMTSPLVKNELVDFKLEYFNGEGQGNVELKWFSQSHPEEIIPATRFYPFEHTVKRYEAHLAIPAAMTAWQAFEEVMERAPGWHWQDVNGKITFLSPGRDVEHDFIYDPDDAASKYNIASKTFEAAPRPADERINYQRYEFRDVETEGYTQSYLEVHREGLRELQGGLPSDTPMVRLGVMTRSLAERIAETRMRLLSDPERQFVLRGQLDSYRISKGDRVTLSHFLSGDKTSDPVECIVTAETTGGNADEKTYTLLPVQFPFYEDEPE